MDKRAAATVSGIPLDELRCIDISIPVRVGTPEWPGDTPYSCRWTATLADGASVQLSAIAMSPHVGTHADAPLHVALGGTSSDALPLNAFAGPARVLTIAGDARDVGFAELEPQLHGEPVRLVFRTGQTIADGAFPADWPALTPACASELAHRGVRLVAVDCPSVDRRSSRSLATHHALFDAGAFVLENLDLRAVDDGDYLLIAHPLLLQGLDAAPARAVLLAPAR